MKYKFLSTHYHFLLLIAFFVLHSINEFFGLIPHVELLLLLFVLVLASTTLFFMLNLMFKFSKAKAGILTTFLLIIFLFFGVIQDVISVNPVLAYFSELKRLLIIMFVLSLMFIVGIKKYPLSIRFVNYINFVLFVLIAVELILIVNKFLSKPATKNNIAVEEKLKSGSVKYPVYVLVLDAYAGDS
jgi:hypothetical protein